MIYKINFSKLEEIFVSGLANVTLNKGDSVIFNTKTGEEFGIVTKIFEKTERKTSARIIRKATPEDIETYKKICEESIRIFNLCKDKSVEHKLPIKLIETRLQFDNRILHIYYIAEQKINLKSFLKEIANIYKGKIEVHSVGSRESVRQFKPCGVCGRHVCCSAFLTEFIPIGMDLIELQNLSCGTSKLTGVCGRLMCCLAYEKEHYKQAEEK